MTNTQIKNAFLALSILVCLVMGYLILFAHLSLVALVVFGIYIVVTIVLLILNASRRKEISELPRKRWVRIVLEDPRYTLYPRKRPEPVIRRTME